MLPAALVGVVLTALALGSARARDVRVDDVHLVSRRLAGLGKRSLDGLEQRLPPINLTLLHVNDVHAHLDEYQASGIDCDGSKQCFGGYARVIDEVARVRASNGNVPVLLLNAGDEFQGSLFFSYYGPSKIAETLNLLGYDAFAPGNHEFDLGPDDLAEFLGNLSCPAVSTNIKTTHPALAAQLQPFLVFEEHDLALVALTTVDTPFISKPGPLTHFEDVLRVQDTVDGLLDGRLGGRRADGSPAVKRVIALTHIGYEQDILLARSTRGISAIVGGHSHTPLGGEEWYSQGPYPTIETNLLGEEVAIVTAYRWAEHVGKIDLSFEAETGRFESYTGSVVRLTEAFSQNEDYQDRVKEWRKPFDEFAKTVVGKTKYDLDQASCQFGECTMGDMVANALLWARTSIGADVDAAIHNSGGIRNGVSAPNITLGTIATAFPFDSQLVDIQLTGNELWNVFEGVASKVNVRGKTVTSTVQVSGIRYEFNPKNKKGSRLISLRVGPDLAEVDMERTYKVVTLDFIATGGDSILPDPYKVSPPGVASETDVITDYVRDHTPLAVKLDGRIQVTNVTAPRRPAAEWGLEEMVAGGPGQPLRLAPETAGGWGGWAEWVRERRQRLARWE